MSQQHTPGPWEVHAWTARVVPADHVLRPIGSDEDPAKDRETYAQEICLLHWPDRNRSEAEVQANARLIASAPELLEALSNILANARLIPDPSMQGATDVYAVPLDDIEAAVAVLAKANSARSS